MRIICSYISDVHVYVMYYDVDVQVIALLPHSCHRNVGMYIGMSID